MKWAEALEELELPVTCGRQRHLLRWVHGEIELADHPDVDAERALVAFGGEEPRCLELLSLWQEAVVDGGFLGEWVDEDLDKERLWWLSMALERMRSEGFHEFLRDLPVVRAGRMGQFVTCFPAAWLDRAAAAAAELMVDGAGVVCTRAPQLLPLAVARRLRRSFVTSIGGRQVALGGAALVPFEPSVGEGAPLAEGIIDGRASWVRIGVRPRWLFEVWGAGAAVVGGHLVLDIDYASEFPVATVVEWATETVDTRTFRPSLRAASLVHDESGWHLRDDQ